MTHCTGAPAEKWLEQYVEGTLPDPEAQAFEEHYFDCPVCLAQLQSLQAVAAQLGHSPAAKPHSVLAWPKIFTATAALAAALLIVAVGSWMATHRPSQPAVAARPASAPPAARPAQAPSPAAAALSQLADLTLPPFQAASLREAESDSFFQTGMKAYAGGDCPGAIDRLSYVPAQDEDALAARFYSALCQMHEGDLAAASTALNRVTRAGDSPQLEAAWYYLAQIKLAQNDAASAHRFLDRVIALHGDFELRARKQLTSFPAETHVPAETCLPAETRIH